MEDIIMHSEESLDGSHVDDKCGSPKVGLDLSSQQSPSKSLPKLCYSRELIMKLKNHPQSKVKPISFDSSDYVSKSGQWDPEHWHGRTTRDSKRTNSISIIKEEQQDKKRGKEEGDEFCFTPQRRSFVSGCHVVPSRRQDLEAMPAPIVNEVRETALTTRRVGSGRLTGRDSELVSSANAKDPRERREPLRAGAPRERTFERGEPLRGGDRGDRDRNDRVGDRGDRDRNDRGGDRGDRDRNDRGGDRDRNERGDRHDRNDRGDRSDRGDRNDRGFGRSDLRDKGPEKDRRNFERSGFDRDFGRNGRLPDRRKNEDDTPEWFNDGPISQHDTIELRGFDEERDKAKNIKATSKKEMAKERQAVSGKKADSEKSNSRPSSRMSDRKEDHQPASEQPKRKSPNQHEQMDFNIEDILKMDSDGLNGLGLGSTETSSKASRWFGKAQQEQPQTNNPSTSAEAKGTNQLVHDDPGRSILEMLQKGPSQPTEQHQKVMTAEELERSAGKVNNKDRSPDDSMGAFNKFLGLVQESSTKPHAVMNSAPTEHDLLANLLGKNMKLDGQGQKSMLPQPPQDALSKFLQQQNAPVNQQHQQNNHAFQHHQMMQHQQPHGFPMPSGQQPHPDVQALMRDAGINGMHPQTLNQLHMMAIQQQQQQQQQQRQTFTGSPQQPPNKQQSVSSSPLSFTPTSVMRKMTAEKDKPKTVAQTDTDESASNTSPPTNSNAGTSNRLTGRTASQVQGASRVSSQLGMNESTVAQQQQLLTGRPLVKGQEGMPPFQQAQHMGTRPPFHATNAAITGVAVKMLEQQQQHQLLAAAIAASANQNQQQQLQLKQQQLLLQQQLLQQQQQQQQQRTSPLQQSLLAFANLQQTLGIQSRGAAPSNVPMGNRTHFRPIHPQPAAPQGFSQFMGNQPGMPSGPSRPLSGLPTSNQFFGVPPASHFRGPNQQGMNTLASVHQQYSGTRSPNMLQGGNPLARWFPPEILSQAGSGQMPNLPAMPNQKILSLEELERLHTSPMSH